MQNLSFYITDLIRNHDCVIMPNFGAFFAHYQGAKIDEKRALIFPPSKRISFNSKVQQNDGLLVSRIVELEKLAYPEALKWLGTETLDLQRKLKEEGRFSMKGLGEFILNQEKNIEFFPENEMNYLMDSFGLSPVTFDVVPKTEHIDVGSAISGGKSWKKWAAAAVILPFAAASFFFGYQNKEEFIELTHLHSTEVHSDYQNRIEEEDIAFNYGNSSANFEKLAAESNEEILKYSFVNDAVEEDGIAVRLKEKSELELYFIVGGAFREKKNAENLVKELQRKGYDSRIFGKKGSLHLVCYGSYVSKSSASSALNKIKQDDNRQAWLKKN